HGRQRLDDAGDDLAERGGRARHAGGVGGLVEPGRARGAGAVLAATAARFRRGVIMGRMNTVLLSVLVACSGLFVTASAQNATDRLALRRQIDQRFVVLPVQGGIVLTPKRASRDVRSIELTNGAIAINGEPVTGAELKRRLGADADAIIR